MSGDGGDVQGRRQAKLGRLAQNTATLLPRLAVIKAVIAFTWKESKDTVKAVLYTGMYQEYQVRGQTDDEPHYPGSEIANEFQ